MKHIILHDGRRWLIGREKIGSRERGYHVVATSTNEYLAFQIAMALDIDVDKPAPLHSESRHSPAEAKAKYAKTRKVAP